MSNPTAMRLAFERALSYVVDEFSPIARRVRRVIAQQERNNRASRKPRGGEGTVS